MGKNKKIGFIIGLLFMCCFLLKGNNYVCAEDLTENNQKVTVKVAFYQLDGFFEYDKNGEECGYGVDFLNELTKYSNIEWEYVPADSWEGIKEMMLNGDVDVRMPTSEPTTPSQTYDYTLEPIMSSYYAIMTLKDRSDLYYEDYEQISKMKLAITQGLLEKTGFRDYLESIGTLENLVYYDEYNSCLEALRTGEVDGLISNVMDLTDDMKVLDKFGVVDNYITTLKGNPNYTAINNAITRLELENPSFQTNLYEKYYPDRTMEPFTKEESEYIAATDHLTVAVYKDRKPVSYYDEETKSYKGIAIDVANKISEKIGIPFEYVPVTTENQFQMLEHADLVMPVPNNKDEEKFFVTQSFLNSEILMAVQNGKDELTEGCRVGVLRSTPGILQTMKNLNTFEIVEYENNDAALKALQKGKIDAFANSSYVLNWILENPRYNNLTNLHYQSFSLEYDMAGNLENQLLRTILDKGIHSISDSEVEKIVQEDSNFSMQDMSFKDKLYINRQLIITIVSVFAIFVLVALFYNHSRTIYIQKIEESRKKQEMASHAKSDFLARMSHDMRTPLNVIMGMGKIAKENENPKDTDDCLDKMNVASEFLLGLINDVLDMEHIESGKITLHPEPYSGEEFKQYIESVIRPLCEQKNIKFKYTYDGPAKFILIQDKLRTNQVYFNILSNAVKYTPEGGSVCFHTHMEQIENHQMKVDVTIKDTGIGMDKKFMEHMFEPFSQENQEIKPVNEGSGLGLYIVHKLCRLMNMNISAESEKGKGTTFMIYGNFPLMDEKDTEKMVQEDCKPMNFQQLKKKTILVCEDHPLNQEIIRRLLEKKEMIVVMADDGKRGVETFEHSSPGSFAAILMDIRMPVLDGIQATRKIRELSRQDAKTIPIIALTANAYEEDAKKCLDAGMNAHLAKPIDPGKLMETLEKLIALEVG